MTERYFVSNGYRFVLLTFLMLSGLIICVPGCHMHLYNEILAQSTLYPFHFVENDSRLNAVGRYDFDILLMRFKDKEYSGKLHIRQGEVSEKLYSERIKHIVSTIERAGVKKRRINVVDVAPDGELPQGERVIEILQDEDI